MLEISLYIERESDGKQRN